jgi:hypothetical protein
MNNNNDVRLLQTLIRFPDLRLQTRDAHQLRGYFGNLFREHSPLLHNHYEDGKLRYGYPLVQYKIIQSVPCLVGLEEGARLLIDLFLKIKTLDIEGKSYPILSKNIENRVVLITDTDELYTYRFETLWFGLNEKNFQRYLSASKEEKQKLLQSVLTGNILSFYKGIGFHANRKILLKLHFQERSALFKNQKMIAFKGNFICNAVLPEYIGLGKAVSRGFGTIRKDPI